VLLVGVLGAAGLDAQRPSSAVYESDRLVQLEGPVFAVEWTNPRAYLRITVRDGTGTAADWAVEIGSASDLERAGWNRDTARIGAVVTVEAAPAQGTRRLALARSVVLKDGGRRLFTTASPRQPGRPRPAPRWPDGQVRLGPPPGQKGYWGPASATALVERSATPVRVNQDGLLLNLGDVDRVAPFLPWSRALYLHRQRTRLKDDPLARCIPPGGPRQFLMPHGFQFVEQRELGRVLVLLGGGNRNWRVIHTDGRPQGQPAEVVLGFYGNSVGRWEQDTLVVDSIGYNEQFWFTSGGLPHTEALHLVERFSRPDYDTLRYDVTVDDPRTYSHTWTGGWTVQWIADEEMREAFCEENPEATFVR